MNCESCKKELTIKDWPYLFRGLCNLCDDCKKIAFILLTRKEKIT